MAVENGGYSATSVKRELEKYMLTKFWASLGKRSLRRPKSKCTEDYVHKSDINITLPIRPVYTLSDAGQNCPLKTNDYFHFCIVSYRAEIAKSV
jgi:hypothetical protein